MKFAWPFPMLLSAAFALCGSMHAGIITVPPALAPGAQYRLVFVTSDATNALSSVIADYNAFVTSEANSIAALANLSTTWTVIASTPTVNAVVNVGATGNAIGIYRLDGALVAPNTTSMFSGSLSNAVLLNQNGTQNSSGTVWTGSSPNGIRDFGLGHSTSQADFGGSTAADHYWLSSDTFPTDYQFSVYAISGVLTAPGTATPEPSTLGMTAVAAIAFCAGRRHSMRR